MLKRIETDTEKVFAVLVSGTLSQQDYQYLVPEMEKNSSREGKINLYWEMDEFDGWEPGGLWEDLKFDVKHIDSFTKIALVGDQKWEKWLTRLMAPFTTAQVQFFPLPQRDNARAWVGFKNAF